MGQGTQRGGRVYTHISEYRHVGETQWSEGGRHISEQAAIGRARHQAFLSSETRVRPLDDSEPPRTIRTMREAEANHASRNARRQAEIDRYNRQASARAAMPRPSGGSMGTNDITDADLDDMRQSPGRSADWYESAARYNRNVAMREAAERGGHLPHGAAGERQAYESARMLAERQERQARYLRSGGTAHLTSHRQASHAPTVAAHGTSSDHTPADRAMAAASSAGRTSSGGGSGSKRAKAGPAQTGVKGGKYVISASGKKRYTGRKHG